MPRPDSNDTHEGPMASDCVWPSPQNSTFQFSVDKHLARRCSRCQTPSADVCAAAVPRQSARCRPPPLRPHRHRSAVLDRPACGRLRCPRDATAPATPERPPLSFANERRRTAHAALGVASAPRRTEEFSHLHDGPASSQVSFRYSAVLTGRRWALPCCCAMDGDGI